MKDSIHKELKPDIQEEVFSPDNIDKDDPLVEEVFQYLGGVFVKHFHSAMLEAGEYLIEKFYAGDYEAAQEKDFSKDSSLSKLFLKIQSDNSGNVPKKTWLYNSIDLAIDHKKYIEVSAYGKLGHSHKVKLTNTGCLSEEVKLKLIDETVTEGYSVKTLQERISEEKKNLDDNLIILSKTIEASRIQSFDTKKLNKLKHQTEKRFSKTKDEMELYKKNLATIDKVLEGKNKSDKGIKPTKK